MPVNHAKEFLKSIHMVLWFNYLFSRASNGRQYSRIWNVHLKINLCSVFQDAEFEFHGCSWIWENRVCINPQGQTKSWTNENIFCFFYLHELHEILKIYIVSINSPTINTNPVVSDSGATLKLQLSSSKNTSHTDFQLKFSTPGILAAIISSGKKLWQYSTSVIGFQKFFCMVDWHEETDFWLQ